MSRQVNVVDKDADPTALLGLVSASLTAGLLVAYAVTLILGFAAIDTPGAPIPDPWFTALELLILCLAPVLVLLAAVIAARAPAGARVFGLAALAFMAMSAALTSVVHFSILTLSRSSDFAGLDHVFGFRWPSVVYALDILAWDVFFALSVLCAAPTFRGGGLAAATRWLLVISGVLSLAGLSGAVTGDMNLRNIGIVGYVGVFLIATVTMAVLFRRERS
jgi:hypothetical protein